MTVTGTIFGFDLAVVSGVAEGRPGEKPTSYSVTLRQRNDPSYFVFSNLIAFLNDKFQAERPALVVKEAMLPLGALLQLGMSESVVRVHAGLHATVEGMCGRFGVRWEDVRDGTYRKHFLGQSRFGSRNETKAATVNRCHLLGLMPRDCNDNNRADALAIWDWAAATYGSRSASMMNFHLFGERTASDDQQQGQGNVGHRSGSR
jgi:hypothetical protein